MVRTRNILHSINDEFNSLEEVCTHIISKEFDYRLKAYFDEENELANIFKHESNMPFEADFKAYASERLTKILNQMVALVLYLKTLI